MLKIAAIAASVKEWGWTTPVLVSEDGGLVAGHARVLAARQLGIAERLNKVLVLRLDPEGFDPETKGRTIDGVVAYSAICPHTGCDVTNWQCALKARIISGGGFHPDNCR